MQYKSLIALLLTLTTVATMAVAQPSFTDQPEDMTLMPGQRISISLSILNLGGSSRDTAYIGEQPDTSNPLPDAALVNVSGTVTFFAPPAVETTSYWLRICSDFGCADSRTFTLFVEGGDTGPSAPFEDAEELGDDWFRSAWLGDFNIAFFPWIFHAQHSWIFIFDGSTADSVFPVRPSLGGVVLDRYGHLSESIQFRAEFLGVLFRRHFGTSPVCGSCERRVLLPGVILVFSLRAYRGLTPIFLRSLSTVR